MTHFSRAVRALVVVLAVALGVTAVPLLPLAIAEGPNTAAAGSGPILARYAVPAGIDPTGTTDVTAALQAFLVTVSHHSQIDFPAGARFRIEGTLRVAKRNDFVIDGHGSTFFATRPTASRTRSQWSFENDSNLEVMNMTIRGANAKGGVSDGAYVAALEAQHGISILGGERIDIHNVNISDTYGDFVYVGQSASPVSGRAKDVHIHDNVFRRNGRMGIAVVAATGVVIDHNDIADTRRATIDLEPNVRSGIVRDVQIIDNKIGPGRLLFVAAHGAGDVSNIIVAHNTLTGHSMNIDMAGPAAHRRSHVVVVGNTSDTDFANRRGAAMRFVNYDDVVVRDNVQPMPANRHMSMVDAVDSCNVTSVNNDLGAPGAGQLITGSRHASCGRAPAPVVSTSPNIFDGQRLMIDVGGSSPGGVSCVDVAHCNGYLDELGHHATTVTAKSVAGTPALDVADRTMLMGNMQFSIPIRSGTYRVTMAFVEPAFHAPRKRRFNVDSEHQRKLRAFDTYEHARGADKVVRRAFTVTVGDGTLDLRLSGGAVPAIVSSITIDRI